MRDTLIVRVGVMPCPKTGSTHYNLQFGLRDKGCAIKGLVVYYVVWLESMGWVFGQGQGALPVPLLWSGWLLSSSSTTPHKCIQIHIIHTIKVLDF